MDEKELKKLLEKELDALTPSMSDKVRKARILTKSEQREKSTQKVDFVAEKKRSKKPYLIGSIAAVLVVAIALAVVLPSVFGGTSDTPATYEAGYLRMDVNPSVEIIYDKDNKVTAVKSANNDADVLLSAELRTEVVGKPVDEAAAVIAEEAGKLGFLSTDNDGAVRITVVANSDKQREEVLTKTSLAIESNFMERGIFVAVVAVERTTEWLADEYGVASDSLKETVQAVATKADSYFAQLAETNADSLENLKTYYENEVFDYLKDLLNAECNKISKTRELLHSAKQLNDRISSYNSILFGADYWASIASDDWKDDPTLVVMINEMKAVLDRIETLRNDPVDNGADLFGLVMAYDLFIDEEWISEIGNATLDDLKAGFDEIIGALEDLNIEITQALRDAVMLVPSSVSDFLDGSKNVIDSMREELYEVYLDSYLEERDALSAEDYQDFYLNINTQYGSLEAYWGVVSGR